MKRATNPSASGVGRRTFLKTLSTVTLASAVGSATARSAPADPLEGPLPPDLPSVLPQVTFAGVKVPRMFIGSNPIGGWSHSVRNLSLAMPDYFTVERTVQFLKRCEKAGLDVWLSYWADKPLEALRILWDQGSKIRPYFMGTLDPEGKLAGAESGVKDDIRSYKPIFYVHHGNSTDFLFSAGKHERVHDFVKKVHDELNIPAGISAHNPDCIKYVEDKGWEVDFYQTCFYYVTRPKEEIRAKLGTAMLGEPFLESDPDHMTEVIRQVKKPCIGFKILAAGWRCDSDRSVESAFQYALARVKPSDVILVGMWPKYKDEVAQNVRLLCKHGFPVTA